MKSGQHGIKYGQFGGIYAKLVVHETDQSRILTIQLRVKHGNNEKVMPYPGSKSLTKSCFYPQKWKFWKIHRLYLK